MGSAGGAMVIDTPNCANRAAGRASIRTASNRKREVRILNHLARSSFDCPVQPCCCGLRGVRAMGQVQELHGCTEESDQSDSLCRNDAEEDSARAHEKELAPTMVKATRA